MPYGLEEQSFTEEVRSIVSDIINRNIGKYETLKDFEDPIEIEALLSIAITEEVSKNGIPKDKDRFVEDIFKRTNEIMKVWLDTKNYIKNSEQAFLYVFPQYDPTLQETFKIAQEKNLSFEDISVEVLANMFLKERIGKEINLLFEDIKPELKKELKLKEELKNTLTKEEKQTLQNLWMDYLKQINTYGHYLSKTIEALENYREYEMKLMEKYVRPKLKPKMELEEKKKKRPTI
jgi:hypothetical protein